MSENNHIQSPTLGNVKIFLFILFTIFYSIGFSCLKITLPAVALSIRELMHDDGDGNGKKATALDKENNNFVRASHFFAHFFAVVSRLRRETA